MKKRELKLILQKGEDYKVEFKENVNSDLAKEMVAFANSSGGRIFIGINDKNEISGIKDSNSLSSEIQVIASSCDPPVAIEIEKFENILIIHVKEGLNKPYRANKGFFIRNGANSQKMATREIIEFVQDEEKVKFDQTSRDDLDINEVFNPNLLYNFLRLAKIDKILDDYSTLKNLSVLNIKNNKYVLNNAGIIFFSDEMDKYMFHSRITCALFKGTEKHTVLNRKDFAENIIKNIENTILFLKQHLKVRYEITTLQRRDILEIPEVALREAVVNAVCHRNYYEKGANVMVEIYDDRVEIYNPGGLPKGLLPKDFGKLSIPRNPIITNLLLRANYIEKMGTGISRIKSAMIAQEHKEPKFEFDSFFHVIFPRRIEDSSPITSPEIIITNSEKILNYRKDNELIKKGSEKNSEKILKYIEENSEITIKELSNILNITSRTVEKNIAKLKQQQKIKRIGSDKSGHWEIIYKKDLEESRIKTSTESSEKNSDKILKYIKENSEITVEELSELLDVSIKTVETHIQKLKELKKIQYIKPSKNGYWEIIESDK